MFMFGNDGVSFTVIGQELNEAAELLPLSFWYEIPDEHYYLEYAGQRYSSLAEAFISNVWCPADVNLEDLLLTSPIQIQLRLARVPQDLLTREKLQNWLKSIKPMKDAIKIAHELNRIFTNAPIARLLEELVLKLIIANPAIRSLLDSTMNSCLVFDTYKDDFEYSSELGCGSDGQGLNLLGLAWMKGRTQVDEEQDVPPQALYDAFKTARLAVPIEKRIFSFLQPNIKKPLRELPGITEWLPVANDRTTPYLLHKMGLLKSNKAFDARRQNLYNSLLNQTLLLLRADQTKLFKCYIVDNVTLNEETTRHAPPVSGARRLQPVVKRSTVTDSLMKTIQDVSRQHNESQVCVFQTYICKQKGEAAILDFVSNELAISSSYLCSIQDELIKDDQIGLATFKIVVSKDVLVVRGPQFELLAPKDQYMVTIITALCQPTAVLSEALDQQYNVASLIRAEHIIIGDLQVVRAETQNAAQVVQMHDNKMDSLVNRGFKTLTMVVPDGELLSQFSLSTILAHSQDEGLQKEYPNSPEVVSKKNVCQDNKKKPENFLGVNEASLLPTQLFLFDQHSIYFCFKDCNEADFYYNRLRSEHKFEPAKLCKRDSKTLHPVQNEFHETSWFHTHRYALEVKMTKTQYERLETFMTNNREFWRPFTQSLIKLIDLHEHCIQVSRLKIDALETRATYEKKQNYNTAMLNLCDSLFVTIIEARGTDNEIKTALLTQLSSILTKDYPQYLTPPPKKPENPSDLYHVRKFITELVVQANQLETDDSELERAYGFKH